MMTAQLTDIHLDDFMNKEYKTDVRNKLICIVKDIKKREITEVIITGDLGTKESFPWISSMMKENHLNCSYILGNHDSWWDLGKTDGLYWSRKHDRDLFFYLDSHRSEIGTAQKDWLLSVLDRETYDRVFIYIHHPVLKCDNSTIDNLYPLNKREEISTLLESLDKKVYIFSGHYHGAHEVSRGRLYQYVTPSVLVQLKKNTETPQFDTLDYAYRIIKIKKGTVTTELIPFEGVPL